MSGTWYQYLCSGGGRERQPPPPALGESLGAGSTLNLVSHSTSLSWVAENSITHWPWALLTITILNYTLGIQLSPSWNRMIMTIPYWLPHTDVALKVLQGVCNRLILPVGMYGGVTIIALNLPPPCYCLSEFTMISPMATQLSGVLLTPLTVMSFPPTWIMTSYEHLTVQTLQSERSLMSKKRLSGRLKPNSVHHHPGFGWWSHTKKHWVSNVMPLTCQVSIKFSLSHRWMVLKGLPHNSVEISGQT